MVETDGDRMINLIVNFLLAFLFGVVCTASGLVLGQCTYAMIAFEWFVVDWQYIRLANMALFVYFMIQLTAYDYRKLKENK